MAAALVDTDILIDVARGTQAAIARLEALEKDSAIAISPVTRMEMIVGCRNKLELKDLDLFLARFDTVPLSPAVGGLAIELLREFRLSHGLLIPDALIASTALVHRLPLLTRNVRDYRFIPELDLLRQ